MHQLGPNYLASLIETHNRLYEAEQAGADISAELAEYNATRALFGLPPVDTADVAEADAPGQGQPRGS